MLRWWRRWFLGPRQRLTRRWSRWRVLWLAFLLRRVFPERFTRDSLELALAIASGDYPQVKLAGLPRVGGTAPVLMFGSAFRDPSVYPNMMAMPMPDFPHMPFFEQWVVTGTVCNKLEATTNGGYGRLVFGKEKGLDWDTLIVSS